MSVNFAGKKVTAFPGLLVKSKDMISDAVVAFENVNTAPTTTTGKYFMYVDGGVLKYDNGASVISITGGAPGTVPSWETLYLNDATFALTTAPWTISQSAAANLLALNKTNVGAGTVLAITNSGTGKDITGSAWSIVTAAAVGVLELTSGGTINATDGALSIGKTGTATSLVGTCTIAEGLTLTSGNATISSGNLTLTSGNATISSGTFAVSAGASTFASAANAATLSVTNNTITTYGAAAASGAVEFSSTSLTTGTLLHLELTEGTLNGGYYLRAWDVTAGASVFSIAEDGVVVMAGTAGGSSFTMTAGDMLLSDGSVTLVDADNAATFSVTNNAATTVGAAASTGIATLVSTSLTTGALLNLELTEGTLNGGWYVRAWDATAAAAVFSIGEDGLTTITGAGGSNMLVVTAGDAVLSDGSLIITDADNAASLSVTNDTATTASVVAIAGSGAFSGITASSFMTVTPSGLTTGTGLYLATNALTTGKSLDITATAATDGTLLNLTGGGVNMTANGFIVAANMGAATVGTGIGVYSTGVYAGTTGLLSVTANSMTTGKLAIMSATGMTTGTGLEITGGGVNLTTGKVLSVAMGAATTGTGINLLTTGVYTGSGLLNIVGSSATTGTLVAIGGAGLTSGTALKITATEATLTSGLYIQCYDGAANDFSVGKYGATVIAGNATTTAFTITAGNAVITAGNATLTLGNVVLTEGSLIETPQAIVNANTAIDVTHGITTIANNGASTHTLADGTVGQRKTIVCTVYTADAVITPANLANGSTLTLNAVGDACDLVFLGTEWWVTNLYGTASIA